MPNSEKPEKDTVSETDKAYNGILELVLGHQLRPGERTSVMLLASRLNLGRTPVKEAITRLQTEGLLSVSERSGTTVNAIDVEEAKQLFALRQVLEDFAAEQAVKHATPTQIKQLKELAKQMRRQSVDSKGRSLLSTRFVNSNVTFHALIVAASGNQYLARLYTQIQMHVQIVTYLISRGDDPDAAAARQKEHEAIVAALADRDAKRLKSALRAHAQTTARIILQNFDSKRAPAVKKPPRRPTAEARPRGVL
jgi:DNA-binding GntR family transcriptional regulator